jgi:hypothetical protein
MFKAPEQFRHKKGDFKTTQADGNNGVFIIHSLKLKNQLTVICSDGMGWEHVSISLNTRSPTWEEMTFVKNKFWDKEDLVVQFHPVESDYINNHEFCLHLWRRTGTNDFCETPPSILVGIGLA